MRVNKSFLSSMLSMYITTARKLLLKRIVLAFGLICLCPAGGHTMEEDGSQENRSLFGRICEFRRERIAGLYYTTSVTGYGSSGICISEFLRQNFREGWSLVEFQINGQVPIRDPHYTSAFQNGLKFFPSVLEKNPGCSANDLRSIQQSLKYSYLFKESKDNHLIILPLVLAERCDFALKSCKTGHDTFDDVSKDLEKTSRSSNDLSQKQLSLIKRDGEVALEIINLRYGNLDEAEKIKRIEVLSEQQKKIEEEKAQIECQRSEMTKLSADLVEDFYNHVVVHENKSVFDLSGPSFYAQNLLTHLADKFAGQPIEIHTLLRNNSAPPHSIAGHVLAVLRGADENSRRGHFSYAHITLNEKNIDIRVTNPTFDTDQPGIKKTIFGHADPLPLQSLRFFQAISETTGLDLKHTYHYRGDQVLNFHDCGRFSMIYLLATIKGRDPLTLSNYEIYQGFKELLATGYDDIHQRKYDWNPIPKVPSKFSRFIGGTVRASCDYPVALDLSAALTVTSLLKNLW